MNIQLVDEALGEVISSTFEKGKSTKHQTLDEAEGFTVAEKIYAFVVNYPVDWHTTALSAKLIVEVMRAAKRRYPFLSDKRINGLGNHFAYLHK